MKEDRKDLTSDSFASCPLCSDEPQSDGPEPLSASKKQELLLQHITGHLQYLSLTCLPHPHSDEDPKLVATASSTSPISHQLRPPPPNVTRNGQIFPDPLVYGIPFARPFLASDPRIIIRASRPPLKSAPPPPPPPQSVPYWSAPPEELSETFDVLLVEDNRVNQRLFTKMLHKYRHNVITTENGLEGVKAVRRRKFDLIFMDMSMPVMVRPSLQPRSPYLEPLKANNKQLGWLRSHPSDPRLRTPVRRSQDPDHCDECACDA
jgi:hypothetical protein